MTKIFTSQGSDAAYRRIARWPAILAALLIAVAAPTEACEKSTRASFARAPDEQQNAATFTGEFVHGAPVYRLPSITVVSRRPAEIARTQRDVPQARPAATVGARAKAPIPAGKVASASRAADAIEPCVG